MKLQSLETAPKDEKATIHAVTITPLRWLPYRPLSQQVKSGILGRWQIWNGYGWQNADVEQISGWIDNSEKVEVAA